MVLSLIVFRLNGLFAGLKVIGSIRLSRVSSPFPLIAYSRINMITYAHRFGAGDTDIHVLWITRKGEVQFPGWIPSGGYSPECARQVVAWS